MAGNQNFAQCGNTKYDTHFSGARRAAVPMTEMLRHWKVMRFIRLELISKKNLFKVYQMLRCQSHSLKDNRTPHVRLKDNTLFQYSTELCIRGDFRGRFHLGERNCEQVIRKSPWQCYNSPYQTECCESCLDIRDPYDAGKYTMA